MTRPSVALLLLSLPSSACGFFVSKTNAEYSPRTTWQLASSRTELSSSHIHPPASEPSKSCFPPLTQERAHAMNLDLIQDLALRQVGLWVVFVLILGVWHRLPSWHTMSSLTPSILEKDTSLAVVSVGVHLAIDALIRGLLPSLACQVDFGTTNLVTALWGRRAGGKFTKSKNTTSAKDALGTMSVLAFVTAFCQQVVFFDFIPGVVLFCTSSHLLSATFACFSYGFIHADVKEESLYLVTLQVLHGIVYICLIGDTEALWPAALAQFLYQTHVWTTTWHTVNDQIDWVHAAPNQPPLTPHDVAVWAALQSHSRGALTLDSVYALQSIFYVFDEERQGYLSSSNVQKAIAYTFWQQGQHLPDPARVQALFEALLDHRPIQWKEDVPVDRLSWVEFVRLLISLRVSTRQQS